MQPVGEVVLRHERLLCFDALNIRPSKQEHAMDLFDAIAAGDEPAALAALDAQPAPGRHPSGPTPVLWALYHGHGELARRLAERVGPLDLAEAAALDDPQRIAQLLDAGAPVDGRTPDGYTPLQLAAFFGGPAAAALLLERGADPSAVADNPMRIQPLHAAVSGRHHDIAARLIAAGVDVNARQQGGYTPLLAAAGNGDAALVRALLDAGADPELADDAGIRPAASAAERGHHALAAELRTARIGG
jgi:ankyrin repeat protein